MEGLCGFCVHRLRTKPGCCFAYPAGIPEPIRTGEEIHEKERPDQPVPGFFYVKEPAPGDEGFPIA